VPGDRADPVLDARGVSLDRRRLHGGEYYQKTRLEL
jgi:hypothetical protein